MASFILLNFCPFFFGWISINLDSLFLITSTLWFSLVNLNRWTLIDSYLIISLPFGLNQSLRRFPDHFISKSHIINIAWLQESNLYLYLIGNCWWGTLLEGRVFFEFKFFETSTSVSYCWRWFLFLFNGEISFWGVRVFAIRIELLLFTNWESRTWFWYRLKALTASSRSLLSAR